MKMENIQQGGGGELEGALLLLSWLVDQLVLTIKVVHYFILVSIGNILHVYIFYHLPKQLLK